MTFRKIRLSIATKLIILITFLLGIALSFYIYYATKIFKEDKIAYIYENSLIAAQALALQMEKTLDFSQYQLQLITTAVLNTIGPFQQQQQEAIFNAGTDLTEFSLFALTTEGSIKQTFGISADNHTATTPPLPNETFLELANDTSTLFLQGENNNGQAMLLILNYHSDRKIFSFARSRPTALQQQLLQNSQFESFLINHQGRILLHNDYQQIGEMAPPLILDFVKTLENSPQKHGVSTIQHAGAKTLIAFHWVAKYKLWALSLIPYQKALSITQRLIRQSLLFGIFVLSFSLIIGIVFARGLTHPLEHLMAATQKISAHDFDSTVIVKTKDELGVLADSFNFMAQEIRLYMAEMKEKIRLEKEVEVAKIVQSSFIPPAHIQLEQLEIAAYYRPASECGGDWWGYFNRGHLSVVMIADATGHGVPAALLTATAYCCLKNLQELANLNAELIASPSLILQFFNHAIFSSNDKILMTCFVGVIDHRKQSLTYSNASHNSPLLLKMENNSPVTKESFRPLIEALGPHLGKMSSAHYPEEVVTFRSQDTLILYTDGLVERLNREEKPYGARRLTKALTNFYTENLPQMVDKIIAENEEYAQTRPADDDLTLLVVKIHEKS